MVIRLGRRGLAPAPPVTGWRTALPSTSCSPSCWTARPGNAAALVGHLTVGVRIGLAARLVVTGVLACAVLAVLLV